MILSSYDTSDAHALSGEGSETARWFVHFRVDWQGEFRPISLERLELVDLGHPCRNITEVQFCKRNDFAALRQAGNENFSH